ncbi:MAG: GGDEF domain-containing protein [Lyngbya sp.]|nr:GGDEF domain-containing protein [Lyngbya sp.]
MQNRIIGYLERQSDLMIVGLSLILALIIGWIDYWVTVDINLSIFYLFPLTLATWFAGKYSGLFLAVFSTILWAKADLYVKQYSHPLLIYWNIGVRLGFFSIVIYLLLSLKKAYEREKKLARIDGLTGLYNRNFFIETLENEMQRAQRYHYPITLAYLDIDYFKKVNDKFGHNRGDRLLQDISNILKTSIRPTDVIARLGGDEFAILLPYTNLEEAKAALDRVYEQLLSLNRDQLSFVGFSMGVVICLSLPESIDILIEQADRLMYSVKHTGKNRPEYALFDPVYQKIDL